MFRYSYSIKYVDGTCLTAAQVRAALVSAPPSSLTEGALRSLDALCARGERYSLQSFDVLSACADSACRALGMKAHDIARTFPA